MYGYLIKHLKYGVNIIDKRTDDNKLRWMR